MTTRTAASTDSDFKRSLLESIKLFQGVEADSISDLLTRCDRIDIRQGQVLLAPEAKNNSIYVVLSGQLQARLGSLNSTTISDLTPGDCTGELSLVEDRDPSTYVVAVEDSHLMIISHEILWLMVDRSHEFAKNLLVVISDRVRSDSKFIAESIGTLRQAERNAVTDALTGLGNRHWMQDMFERELTRSRTDHGQLCLMMIDVDRFKEINDEYGHIIGDQVLSATADALRQHLRPTDLIARFGGDEFSVLLPGTTLHRATITAERLRTSLANYHRPGHPQTVTVSIGLTAASDADNLDSLLHRADEALYSAKEKGRNCVQMREASHRSGPLPATIGK
jgi:diguanylate cyclase (GGDEF)-like protein